MQQHITSLMIKPVRAGFRNILLDTCADLGEGVGPPTSLWKIETY